MSSDRTLVQGSARTQQGALIWLPDEFTSTGCGKLAAWVEKEYGLHLKSYEQLWTWSVQSPALFWEAVWRHIGVLSDKEWDSAHHGRGLGLSSSSSNKDLPAMWPPPLWFQGSKLNFAQNMLRYCAPGQENRGHLALVSTGEGRAGSEGARTCTRAELWSLVARCATSLRASGIKSGDRVASYSSNVGENLVAFLAASAIGAVWVSAAADLAPDAVLDRLATVRPKALFTVNATAYGGKVHDHLNKVGDVIDRLNALPPAQPATSTQEGKDPLDGTPAELTCSPSDRLQTVVIIEDILDHSPASQVVHERQGRDGVTYVAWDEFLAPSTGVMGEEEIEFEQLDFNTPLWILFSSGTTGLPKAIVHRAGGMLLQLAKEHIIHGDESEKDVFFYFTTTGWMMWNYAVGALFTGATLILYDGAPLNPPRVLWDLADHWGVTIFGTSAAYLSALASSGFNVRATFPDLKVKQILSTGSPLRPDLYPFIHDYIKPDILIGSITGGTDICSLFGAHCTALPVHSGEVQCRGLGMHVDVADSLGRSVAHGEEGDLVCRTPFPVQPIGFWNQPMRRYFDAYYSTTPGSWHHGDYCLLAPHDLYDTPGLVMHGRSDGVLNPGGIRFGSSDIYEVLDLASAEASKDSLLHAIRDALVVGLLTPARDDEVVVLFLDVDPDEISESDASKWATLVSQVKLLIRTHRSPRHVPKFIERISSGGVPRTLNAKKVEVPIKKILNGQPTSIVNPTTLQNPESLEQYATISLRLRQELAEQQAALAKRLAQAANK